MKIRAKVKLNHLNVIYRKIEKKKLKFSGNVET